MSVLCELSERWVVSQLSSSSVSDMFIQAEVRSVIIGGCAIRVEVVVVWGGRRVERQGMHLHGVGLSGP